MVRNRRKEPLDAEMYCIILKLSLKHSMEELRNAYKRQALLFHPDKNPSAAAAEQFKRIRGAYEFLLAKKEREEDEAIAALRRADAEAAAGLKTPRGPVIHKLSLTFEELFSGTTKTINFTKPTVDHDGVVTGKAVKKIVVDIARGVLPNTPLYGRREDDGEVDESVQFLIVDKAHKHYSRIENTSNLLYQTTVSPAEYNNPDFYLEIPMLDGGAPVRQLIGRSTGSGRVEFKLAGRGLPLTTWSPARGDIIVQVDIAQRSDYYTRPSTPPYRSRNHCRTSTVPGTVPTYTPAPSPPPPPPTTPSFAPQPVPVHAQAKCGPTVPPGSSSRPPPVEKPSPTVASRISAKSSLRRYPNGIDYGDMLGSYSNYYDSFS